MCNTPHQPTASYEPIRRTASKSSYYADYGGPNSPTIIRWLCVDSIESTKFDSFRFEITDFELCDLNQHAEKAQPDLALLSESLLRKKSAVPFQDRFGR